MIVAFPGQQPSDSAAMNAHGRMQRVMLVERLTITIDSHLLVVCVSISMMPARWSVDLRFVFFPFSAIAGPAHFSCRRSTGKQGGYRKVPNLPLLGGRKFGRSSG
jgi:hypothetical protein